MPTAFTAHKGLAVTQPTCFRTHGNRVFCPRVNGRIDIIDPLTHRIIETWWTEDESEKIVDLRVVDKFVLTSSSDGRIRLWILEGGVCVDVLQLPGGVACGALWIGSEKRGGLLCGCVDGLVVRVSITMDENADPVLRNDGIACRVQPRTEEIPLLDEFSARSTRVRCIVLIDDQFAFAASADGRILKFDIDKGRLDTTIELPGAERQLKRQAMLGKIDRDPFAHGLLMNNEKMGEADCPISSNILSPEEQDIQKPASLTNVFLAADEQERNVKKLREMEFEKILDQAVAVVAGALVCAGCVAMGDNFGRIFIIDSDMAMIVQELSAQAVIFAPISAIVAESDGNGFFASLLNGKVAHVRRDGNWFVVGTRQTFEVDCVALSLLRSSSSHPGGKPNDMTDVVEDIVDEVLVCGSMDGEMVIYPDPSRSLNDLTFSHRYRRLTDSKLRLQTVGNYDCFLDGVGTKTLFLWALETKKSEPQKHKEFVQLRSDIFSQAREQLPDDPRLQAMDLVEDVREITNMPLKIAEFQSPSRIKHACIASVDNKSGAITVLLNRVCDTSKNNNRLKLKKLCAAQNLCSAVLINLKTLKLETLNVDWITDYCHTQGNLIINGLSTIPDAPNSPSLDSFVISGFASDPLRKICSGKKGTKMPSLDPIPLPQRSESWSSKHHPPNLESSIDRSISLARFSTQKITEIHKQPSVAAFESLSHQWHVLWRAAPLPPLLFKTIHKKDKQDKKDKQSKKDTQDKQDKQETLELAGSLEPPDISVDELRDLGPLRNPAVRTKRSISKFVADAALLTPTVVIIRQNPNILTAYDLTSNSWVSRPQLIITPSPVRNSRKRVQQLRENVSSSKMQNLGLKREVLNRTLGVVALLEDDNSQERFIELYGMRGFINAEEECQKRFAVWSAKKVVLLNWDLNADPDSKTAGEGGDDDSDGATTTPERPRIALKGWNQRKGPDSPDAAYKILTLDLQPNIIDAVKPRLCREIICVDAPTNQNPVYGRRVFGRW